MPKPATQIKTAEVAAILNQMANSIRAGQLFSLTLTDVKITGSGDVIAVECDTITISVGGMD